jgi:hypothetical protein
LHANRLCAGRRRCVAGALADDVAPGHELRRPLMFPADPLGTSTIRMRGVPSVAQLQACDSRDPPDLGVAMEGDSRTGRWQGIGIVEAEANVGVQRANGGRWTGRRHDTGWRPNARHGPRMRRETASTG